MVTDRGEPIAELRPLASASGVEAELAALEALGVVTRAMRPKLPPFRPLVSSGRPAADAIVEGREDRF